MSKQDYYNLLGIDRGASADEIKAAFRNKAKEYHPDKNSGDKAAEAKFKAIGEAYEILKDDQKRAAYDRYGHAAFESGAGGFGGAAGGFDFTTGFADIFEEMFGDFMGGRKQGATGRGADLRYNMEISLEDAFAGKETTIKIPGSEPCQDCNSTGSADGSAPAACAHCGGAGKVRSNQGFFMIERTCQVCSGHGRVIKNPCRTCAGTGRSRREKTLAVSIPPGVEDGTRIRLAGEGEPGTRGGNAGDLYIFLAVMPHSLFKREAANLFCEIPVDMATAALGGETDVPGIDGKTAKITLPPGTQHGQRFRLKGQGMSVLRAKSRGDLFVAVRVEVPVHLNKKQQQLLRDFQESLGPKSTPESGSFADKLKEYMAGD